MSVGPDPLARAGRALRYWEARQANVSHNLANTSTTGFKGETIFSRALDDATRVEESAIDLRAGALATTGRDFDLAIQGEGFFVLDTPDGIRLTRNGNFRMEDGFLVDSAGNQLRGEGGPIAIPEGEVRISESGVVLVDDIEVGRVDIALPKNLDALVREDGQRFAPDPEGVESVDREAVSIRQGALEESNVDPVDAMVEMLEIQRRFAAVERTMRVLDEVAGTAASRIGRLK